LDAIQQVDPNGIEQLDWVWHRLPAANRFETPVSEDEEQESLRRWQSLAGGVIDELAKAIRVVRGGFGNSASHYGGAFS
jgi:hypothetical protein